MQVIIVVTPVFFAAIHFTLLGRVLAIFGDKYALIKPKWIVPFFVSVDVASLIIQGVGSGKAAVAEIDSDVDNIDVGGHIVVGGALLFRLSHSISSARSLISDLTSVLFFKISLPFNSILFNSILFNRTEPSARSLPLGQRCRHRVHLESQKRSTSTS